MMRSITELEIATPLSPHRAVRDEFLASLPLLPPERVPLHEAAGRVLAETIQAPRPVPAFDSSAVDGYAIVAGHRAYRLGSSIADGVAVEIMTGHPLPAGADACVPWETTRRTDDGLDLEHRVDRGANVRLAGEDLAAEQVALDVATILTPLQLAVAASTGRTHLLVHRVPRVAIASTGDEVMPPGGTLSYGTVFDANGPMLHTMLERHGARIVARSLLPDDPDAIEAWLLEQRRVADLIVSSGGASVGRHDHLRDVVARLGRIDAWRLDVKPGKPVALGVVCDTPIVVLPGNPAGAFVGGWLFAVGAVRAMQGAETEPSGALRRLASPAPASSDRTTYAPVAICGDAAMPMPARSSVALGTLAAADGFAVVPPGGGATGDLVEVVFPW